jgi:hypothetical protein
MVSLEFFIDIILPAALLPWGSTQPLTEMSTSNLSWGVKVAVAYCWQPYHLHVPIVLKSGRLSHLDACWCLCELFSVFCTFTKELIAFLSHLSENYEMWRTDFVLSFRLSTCASSAPNGRIIMKFGIWVFFESLSPKFKSHYNLTTMTGTLHAADRYTFLIISRSVLLRMRNVSDKSCRENQNTHFVFGNFFFLEKILPCMT